MATHEIHKGQHYRILVGGNIGKFEIVDIDITNVDSRDCFITRITFDDGKGAVFQENAKNVIDNEEFKLFFKHKA